MCPLKAGGGLSVKGFDWAFRGPRRAVSLVLGVVVFDLDCSVLEEALTLKKPGPEQC